MISSMRGAWQGENLHPTDQQDHQMVLGQFVERSTSAPPSSTNKNSLPFLNDERNDGRNGQTLLNNRKPNNVFFSPSNERQPDPLTPNAVVSQSTSLVLGGFEDATGHTVTQGTNYPGTLLSDALLSSGLSEQKMQPVRARLGRSQSAAPTLLTNGNSLGVGPPPGLAGIGSSNHQHPAAVERDNYTIGSQQQRPASTGLIGDNTDAPSAMLSSLGIDSLSSNGAGAVRPAPKTLMDLIQEDMSPGRTLNNNVSFGGYSNLTRNDGRPRTASPPQNEPFDEHFHHRENYSTQHQIQQQYHTHLQQQQQQQQLGMDKQYLPTDQLGGISQGMDRLQLNRGYSAPQQRHTTRAEQYRTHGSQYVKIPVTQVQRGQTQITQHQEVLHQDTGRVQTQSLYTPAHVTHPHAISHHHQQPTTHQFESPQQVYYSNNQPGAPMGALTTATLANGQIVYLNAAPNGGYATIQYHGGPRQSHPHIVHQPRQQVQGHDYISVMPVQTSAGGQVAYWPNAEGGSMGPTVIMNQHAPINMQRQGPVDSSPSRGRTKEVDLNGIKKPTAKPRRGGNGQTGNRRDDTRKNTSPLLEQFRSTKNRDWTMLDIKGHVVEFCQDQNGSRFIQQRLEIGNSSEQQVVMAEVLPAVRQLRNDVFGNYVVQKLLEFGTNEMKAELRDTLKGEMLPLSLQMYGCRVVQKALETLNEDDLPKLLIEFHHNVLSCIHDQNGNHVIQKCIEVMSNKAKEAYAVHDGERAKFFGEQIDFIINDVLDNVTPLSCHPYGCRVLQRILEHCVEPKKVRALDEISKCHKVLLDDQYGNYVIQHVLQYGRHEDRESVMCIVIANGLLQLSKQKFASNVVEKLLKYGTSSQRNILVREMLQIVDDPNTGGSSVVLLMVRDAYANYVVQTTLDVVPEGEAKILLLEELNAHSAQLRQYTFAKHIVTKLSS
mmetsp:Transcript_32756/g.37267  ORF Transcript_32756/g.37267 Transcript_32756/m.37267 type:complete len:938 (+) Transcript_32756:205-3018(+)